MVEVHGGADGAGRLSQPVYYGHFSDSLSPPNLVYKLSYENVMKMKDFPKKVRSELG